MRYLFMRQWTDHTCGPTTLRICAHAFLGTTYSEKEASALCNTDRDGTSWSDLKKGFRKVGLKVHKIERHSKAVWDSWLDAGYFIVAADDLTYNEAHVVVINGNKSPARYSVLDPMNGCPVSRSKDRVIKSAKRTAFAVCAR